ncbi:iron-sulfur cluster-binding domain-containing protein (plasmid) [Pseudomonas sp. App30]|uniref:flavin reductase family protein n=1 Tax=Pseudomonas sp. App30 TaxID=3068990 RepID=UPI003A7FC422
MKYTITQIRMLCPSIQEITVRRPNPQADTCAPGAHFKWLIPGIGEWRHFSVVQLPHSEAGTHTFAIRLSAESTSSTYIRSLSVGEDVELDGPFNHFSYPTVCHEGQDIILAGGIGITPLLGIAGHLMSLKRKVSLHYLARSEAEAAYAQHVQEAFGEHAHLHYSSTAGGRTNLAEIFKDMCPKDHLYVCGPAPMLESIFVIAQQVGVPRDQVHFEIFNAVDRANEHAFTVEAAESGITFDVHSDQTLLQALEVAGLDPIYDCRRGECGVCELDVLEGEVDHRDFIMDPNQAMCSGKIYPCVSRAKGQHLKLAI